MFDLRLVLYSMTYPIFALLMIFHGIDLFMVKIPARRLSDSPDWLPRPLGQH